MQIFLRYHFYFQSLARTRPKGGDQPLNVELNRSAVTVRSREENQEYEVNLRWK